MNIPCVNGQMRVQTIIYSQKIGTIVILEKFWAAGFFGQVTLGLSQTPPKRRRWNQKHQGNPMQNYTYFTPPMPNPPESTFLLRLCIFSLPEFWMTVIHPRIQMFTFMKESVSFHHPIIWTSLKNITPMFLSIEILVHFVFNALIEYREQKYPKNNGINYFMQWLK